MTSRASAELSVGVTDSSADLADEGWADLVLGHIAQLPADDLYLSTSWLRFLEMFGNWDPRYLVAHSGQTAVGGLATHRMDGSGDPRVQLDIAPGHGGSGDASGEGILPCRLAGGLGDDRSGALTRPGLSLRERAAVVDRLFAEAELLAAARGERAVICRFVDAGDVLLRQVLRRRGYVEVPGRRHFVLTPPAGGLEGYIGSFAGRDRNMVRREIRKLRDAGVAITVEPLTRAVIDSVVPLVGNLNVRYGLEPGLEMASTELRMMRRWFGTDAFGVVARSGERPVGFLELIVYRGHAWARHAGFDYEFQRTLPLYFGVLFYGLMDFAESHQLRSIDYRFGADRAKESRGCTGRQTFRAVRMLGLTAGPTPTGPSGSAS